MEKSMDTPSKTKSRTTIWFSKLTSLAYIQKRWKFLTWKDTNTLMFIAALFTTAKVWKQPKCPSTEEWIKMWYIYTTENYSVLHWKDWCWSCSSNPLATWYKELTHRKKPWCWVRLKAEEGDDSGCDGWMASLTQQTWVWASSRRCWRTGKPGVLQSMGLQSQTVEQLNNK